MSRRGLTSDTANRWPLRVLPFPDYNLLLAATRALGRGR